MPRIVDTSRSPKIVSDSVRGMGVADMVRMSTSTRICARSSVDERTHFRLWLTPLPYEGRDVWIGQISRDIGVRFSTKTFTTHKIDGDVDETREFLVQDLLLSGSLTGIGYVRGVGAATLENPRFNFTLDPYFTDGLRAVLFVGEDYASPDDVEFVPWTWPREAASGAAQ